MNNFFSRCVFTFPKVIKQSLNFRPLCKVLRGLELFCPSDCVQDQSPLCSTVAMKGEKGLVRGPGLGHQLMGEWECLSLIFGKQC